MRKRQQAACRGTSSGENRRVIERQIIQPAPCLHEPAQVGTEPGTADMDLPDPLITKLKDGALLDIAEGKFAAIVTVDASLQYQ